MNFACGGNRLREVGTWTSKNCAVALVGVVVFVSVARGVGSKARGLPGGRFREVRQRKMLLQITRPVAGREDSANPSSHGDCCPWLAREGTQRAHPEQFPQCSLHPRGAKSLLLR